MIAFHLGHVVGDQESAKADVSQRADGFERVAVPVAEEALGEVLEASLDVSEVDIQDAVLATEVSDRIQHALSGLHFRPASVAEVESVHGGIERIHGPSESFESVKQAGDSTERRIDGRVVGVQGHADSGRLARRQHAFHVPAVVLPHLIRAVVSIGACRPVLVLEAVVVRVDSQLVLVPRGQGASANRLSLAGAPDSGWHEVVSEDGDASSADVCDGGDHVVELRFAAGLSEHDLVVERHGDVFE